MIFLNIWYLWHWLLEPNVTCIYFIYAFVVGHMPFGTTKNMIGWDEKVSWMRILISSLLNDESNWFEGKDLIV